MNTNDIRFGDAVADNFQALSDLTDLEIDGNIKHPNPVGIAAAFFRGDTEHHGMALHCEDPELERIRQEAARRMAAQ